ncbi:putative sterol-C-methyltransferase family protein [Hibiscus syriacus]|uniref:Sterol-C-methyltransferase family protein n=1 Tax=Hibiscus syriacus TaxID=106335 RepID=A0A6A2X3I5_HIBSY|nr:uncharacterized protein At1g76070-like [Hibiscus syriacus]KAE8656466.1 putative sterol-C-methyltransferase family protein [Hibiscus syriacus]
MEKQAKARNKILKFLPKAASSVSVSFQNHPFSPAKHKAFAGKGFSGPIISMIPAEARRKPKAETFEAQEPTSPKVSCMGQIKHKKSIKKGKRVLPPKPKASSNSVSESSASGEVKKHASKFRRFFSMPKPAKKPEHAPKLADTAPSLGEMRRFASGRDAFASFDWTTQIAPVEAERCRDYYSDDDEERRESDFEQADVIIPFSAPITVGGGGGSGGATLQPRKEINIWKRRTMNPPRPLKLNPTAATD